MIESALGLRPDAFERRLAIAGPVLPQRVNELTLKQLRVGDATVDLGFRRTANGDVRVDVERAAGIDVSIERGAAGAFLARSGNN